MQTHQTSPTPRADAIAGFNAPSFGDEREAMIMLRGSVVGMQVATYACFAAALLLAAGGAGSSPPCRSSPLPPAERPSRGTAASTA